MYHRQDRIPAFSRIVLGSAFGWGVIWRKIILRIRLFLLRDCGEGWGDRMGEVKIGSGIRRMIHIVLVFVE